MATKYWLKAHKYHEKMNEIISELIEIKERLPENDGAICLALGEYNCLLLNTKHIPKEELSWQLESAQENLKAWREEF